jgi:hypothetical protein
MLWLQAFPPLSLALSRFSSLSIHKRVRLPSVRPSPPHPGAPLIRVSSSCATRRPELTREALDVDAQPPPALSSVSQALGPAKPTSLGADETRRSGPVARGLL